MRVVFRVNGVEHEGQTRQLSTCGTFVVTPQTSVPNELQLLFGSLTDAVRITGEVVATAPDGFAVAFHAMSPVTLERFGNLLGTEAGSPSEPPPADDRTGEPLEVEGEDWVPPVSEAALPRWQPEGKALPHDLGQVKGAVWDGLPTIAAPAVFLPEALLPPAAVPAPAPPPATAAPVPAPATGLVAAEPAPVARPSDRRQSERQERSIPVTFENLTTLIKEFTHNISFGGLFVYTDQPLKVESETVVTLIHPVHGERLSLLAKVVHVGSAPTPDPISGAQRYGVGVEFRLPLEELKRVLSDFITSHQKPTAVPAPSQIIQEAKVALNRGARSSHALLGVPDPATPEEVRRAYFRLVDRFHPDRHYGKVSEPDRRTLEELFRRLTLAYEELTSAR